MTGNLHAFVRRLQSLRGVAPVERWAAAQDLASRRTAELAKRGRRRAVTGQVKLVQIGTGPRAANSYFWRALRKHPTWFDVQARIAALEANHPEHRAHFVRESISRTRDPVTIAFLARHPLSSDVIKAVLEDEIVAPSTALRYRLTQDQALAGAFVGAARVTLPADQAEQFAAWVHDLHDAPEERLFRHADSASWWPAGAPAIRPAAVAHRLVIAENADDPDVLALLLPGAAKTTVLLTNDTFGTADLAPYLEWPGVGEITVEHVRSRVTRFSREYVDLHEATAELAREVATQLVDVPDLVPAASDVRHLEIEVADFLFFQALKVRAIETILADATFDHIVLGTTTYRPADEFVRLVAGVPKLTADRRLEVVSLSRSAAVRRQFWWVVESLHDPVRLPPTPYRRPSASLIVAKVDRMAQRAAASLRGFPPTDRPWVAVATANNPAYNAATASYVRDLALDFHVRVTHVGRNATDLTDHLLRLDAADVDIDFLTPTAGTYGSFAQLLELHMSQASQAPRDDRTAAQHAAAWALHTCARRLATSAVAPALERIRTLEHWFAEMDRCDELPAAMVLTPHRNAGVGAFASVARRHGVPTVTVEPHAQDSNYCRYAKVASDYYGVMSEYFRARTAHAFGAGPDRTVVIGSPRQVAPHGHDPVAARSEARAAAVGLTFRADRPELAFFSQPSDWFHVSQIWAIVLDAAVEQNCRVLLKTHPEEPVGRVRAYLEVAERRGCRDHVIELHCDASTAVAMSDIVLTAYSSAGVDAAIRATPVVCVTNGDHEYPLDLAAMVDAHLVRSTDELSDLLSRFRSNRAVFDARARSLLERESQFVTGPGPRLRALVHRAVEAGASAIRAEANVPVSLFLDAPHPVFPV